MKDFVMPAAAGSHTATLFDGSEDIERKRWVQDISGCSFSRRSDRTGARQFVSAGLLGVDRSSRPM